MSKGISKFSAGWGVYRFVSGAHLKSQAWRIGTMAGKNSYGAWLAFLVKNLQDGDFLNQFESVTDSWQKSRLIGERISQLSAEYKKLSQDEKNEFGRQAQAEFSAGVKLLTEQKRSIEQVLSLADPPSAQ